MKPLVKILFAAIFFTGTALTTQASGMEEFSGEEVSPLTFNKIQVSGNVSLSVDQRSKENILVNGEYDRTKISLIKRGHTLIISNTASDQVEISVSVKDLQRIYASGNVSVSTCGKLNVQHLQVFLSDQARADIKADTESLYTYITGNASLKLSGTTKDHTLLKDSVSKINTDALAAVKVSAAAIKTEMIAVSLKGK
ncbi:MAG TPA: DUF2807 domain-containing protein [Pedobacter sp.]|nr:DUF2807 domain-containing protein [Pedobacter sp.]